MAAFDLKINQSQLADVNRMLAGMQSIAGKVIQQSVNRTLTGVRTDSTNEVAEVITPTKTVIRKHMTVNKMTVKNGDGRMVCKGKPLNLSAYKARQTKRGVTVQVLKSSGRKLIAHAFITKRNLVAERFWGGKYGGEHGTKRPSYKFGPGFTHYGVLPKKYRYPNPKGGKDRLHWLTSMAIPDVMGHEPTMNKIMEKGDARLQKNLEDRLNYELNKLK